MNEKYVCEYCGMELSTPDEFHDISLCAKYLHKTRAEMRNEINTLTDSIFELKTLVEELKPYRDGYDANEILPEEGENVIVEAQHEMFLAQCRGDAWYYSFGDKSKVINEVKRWWKLPDM